MIYMYVYFKYFKSENSHQFSIFFGAELNAEKLLEREIKKRATTKKY